MLSTQALNIILKVDCKPKKSLEKREKQVLRLVQTPDSKREDAIDMKNYFLSQKYDISDEKIRKFFMSFDGSWLLSHYFIMEMQHNHSNLIDVDFHDDFHDEMLLIAKDWRNQFFDLGLPINGDYIYMFYDKMSDAWIGRVRYLEPMYRLLRYYLEKEVSEGKHHGRLDKIDYQYVVG